MSRCVVGVLLLVASVAHASAAVVWPSKVRRLEDGKLEYVYDLRPLKAPGAVIDLGADADDAAVSAFKKALPNETKVVVTPSTAKLRVHAAGGNEAAPLASSFAKVATGAFVPGPWDSRPRQQGVPALHPDTPKLLPSADLLLWRQQIMQDEVEAGFLDVLQNGGGGLKQGRGAVFAKILERALERSRSTGGDAQLGARRLAARLSAVAAAGTGRLPKALTSDPELSRRANAELAELTRPQPRFPPQPMFTWSKRLSEAHDWDLGLSRPFGTDREGVAAVLTLLTILEEDAALSKSFEALRAHRDRVFAKPAHDRMEDFRAALLEAGAAASLDRMNEYFVRLGFEALQEKKGAPPFAAAQTPVQRFIAGLGGAEQLHAIDELTLAVQDGRVSLSAEPSEGWAAGRDAWRRELLRPEALGMGQLRPTGEYKDRLTRTFQALYGLDAEVNAEDAERAVSEVGDGRVRLMVPPHLEVEPLADAYQGAAASWSRLAQQIAAAPKLSQVRGLMPDGRPRATTVAKDAAAQEKLMRGLALVATSALGKGLPATGADRALHAAALKFLATWRTDGELSRDARYLLPVGEALDPGAIVHSGVFGVGRRELEVSFEGAPEVVVQTAHTGLFEADTTAAQRYQVPVIVTGSVTVARTAPMEQPAFRALCDKAGRTRDAIGSALPGALVRTLEPVSEGGE